MGEGLCVMSSGTQVPASHDVASSLLGTQTVEGDIWANDAGSGSKRNRSPEGTTLTHVVTQLPPKYIRLGNAVPGCREEEQNPGVWEQRPGHPTSILYSLCTGTSVLCRPPLPPELLSALRREGPGHSWARSLRASHSLGGSSSWPITWKMTLLCPHSLPWATNPLAHHLWSVSGLSNGLVAFPLRDPKGSPKLPHPHLHPSLYCRCLSLGDWPCSLYKPRSIVDSLSPSLSTSHSQVLMILPT